MTTQTTANEIKAAIRTVRDWPKPGVNFRDITTLMQDPATFHKLIDLCAARYRDQDVFAIAAIDARGFILGAPIAYALGCSFVPIRKKGKLPFHTMSETYQLEYGEDSVEMHSDAFAPGSRIVLIDDLVATGGTMLAAASLIKRAGGELMECLAIVNLPGLGGAARIRASGLELFALCEFNEDE